MKRPPNDRGQGKKPIGATAMPQVSIRASQEDLDLLAQIGGNTSAGIRLLCQWYRQQTSPTPVRPAP